MDKWIKVMLFALVRVCSCADTEHRMALSHRWPRPMVLTNGLCQFGTGVECCWGWVRVSWGQCQPVCEHGCKHGECVRPDQCNCYPGYTGKTCNQDENECGLKPRPCKHRCMNTVGSYKCFCLNGYMLMPDGTCRNALTCAMANCQYGCEVMKGEVRCQCPSPGLRLGPDHRTCVDIDECATGKARCPRFRKCVNTFGSYICKCHAGFDLRYVNGKYQCIDHNDRSICFGKPGKKCKCQPGTYRKGYDCKPIPSEPIEPAQPQRVTLSPATSASSLTTTSYSTAWSTTASPRTTTRKSTTTTTRATTVPMTTDSTTTRPPTTTTSTTTTTATTTTATTTMATTTTKPVTTAITTTAPTTAATTTTTPTTTTTTERPTTPTQRPTLSPTVAMTIPQPPDITTTMEATVSITASTTTASTTAAMSSTTTTSTSTLDNRIQQEITQRPRGDVHIPRNPGQNNLFDLDFDIELGNTGDYARDDPGAGYLTCSFDQGVCSWLTDGEGDVPWTVREDPAGGRYLTVSEPVTSRSVRGARLTLPLTPPVTQGWDGDVLCLAFRHRVQGHHIGSLQLFVRKGRSHSSAIWTRTGGHGWRHTQITLWGRDLDSVVLKGERRRGRVGEIAIDDFRIRRGPCKDNKK